MKKQLIYLIVFLCAGAMDAQVRDLLHNKQYEFHNRVIKPSVDKPWLRTEIDFSCHYFADDIPTGHRKLNSGMIALCTAQLDNEDRFIKLEREAVLRLEVYDEINNSRNNANYGKAGRPKLKHVGCEVISVAAGRAMIEMAYRFEYSTQERYNGNVEVRQYYLGNLATGAITPWKPEVNAANIAKLRDLIRDTFNEQYLYGTQKIARDMGGSFANAEIIAGDAFEKVDLRYADFYWYRSGLMVQFQEFVPGTQVFGGRFYRLFFPYEKALMLTALMPEFAYINNLPKVTTTLSNASQDEIFDKTSRLRTAPSPESFAVNYRGPRPVKSLVVTNNQIMEDGVAYLRGSQKLSFDRAGRVLASVSYNEAEKTMGESTYSYSEDGRLLETATVSSQWKTTAAGRYWYDNRGNRIRALNPEPYQEAQEWHYFYNGSYAYGYTHSPFHTNRTNYYVHCYRLTGGKLCLDELCYALNAQGEITGLVSIGGRIPQQLGFDDGGRLVESHFDHDRDNYYFYYDALGRFSKMQVYEFTTKKQEYNFHYDGESTLPVKISKDGFNTLTEQILKWDFYE